MEKVENLVEVLDNGATIPYGLDYEEHWAAIEKLGGKFPAALRWNCPVQLSTVSQPCLIEQF